MPHHLTDAILRVLRRGLIRMKVCGEDENFSLTRRNPELKQSVNKALQDLDPLTGETVTGPY